MKNKILDILRNNITESKNDYNRIYERDFDNLANELLAAINYTHCCSTLCECGGNERVALDCTMKPCKHPKYFKG